MKVLTFFPFIFQVTWPLERRLNTKPELSIYEYSIHNWLFFRKKIVFCSRHFTNTTWIHWRQFEFADLFDFTRNLLNLIFKIFFWLLLCQRLEIIWLEQNTYLVMYGQLVNWITLQKTRKTVTCVVVEIVWLRHYSLIGF